jgi:two-component system response regulator FlrC
MPEALNILVVEDDAAPARRRVPDPGMRRPSRAGRGRRPGGAGLLERQAFNLVVSDLRMQPMDGLQLLARSAPRLPQLPVLLMTAFGDVDKAVSAMRGGACDFLIKPFEPKVLLEHVERYAAQPAQAEGVIAADPRTRNLLALAARVAEDRRHGAAHRRIGHRQGGLCPLHP